ncbi:hypothetical protein PHYBOEH_007468 [Phytophthora boehmeriae]|uniref:Uncharacterized protein n=1 Tax=Phytophthora boehmeriae TaxID=109152 RepID=A0A8T1X6G9_9STRA|nr:hypothetical protein PHYBOEH_007468 [Phytophthora boehmeriae]
MLMPFFFHCIRPNATKQPSSLNKDIVVQQIHSQRLARQVQVCGESDEWIAHHDALVEVGEDPEMFLFHSEDDEFVDTLERFLTKLALEKEYEEEQKVLNAIGNLSRSSSVDEEGKSQNSAEACKEDEEMLGLLLSVQFGPFLMAAMNQDSYFVQALQDSTLMNSMHQLMANPTDFARSTALRQPTVREFFLKLIALSLAIQSD